jgi:TRAP-type C4-dicarboxylate transport system permease small subunit
MPETNGSPTPSRWRAWLLDSGFGADLTFFLSALLALLLASVALDQMPLFDQDRDAVLALHAKITYAALAVMGTKLLLRLVQPVGEDEEE